jgi:predicted cupin superfamily sugar epimerase
MADMAARDLIDKLTLVPHPEGGWYREIYRSPVRVETQRGPRSALTTIHYLLEQQQSSRWHVVEADEVWHFYAGAPLELLRYDPGTRRFFRHVLGDVRDGNAPVAVIETGIWQAARSLGGFSLVGCTVGPGFEFEDFRFVATLPGHAAHFVDELAPFAQLL